MKKREPRYGYTVMTPMQGNVDVQHFVGNLRPCSEAMPSGDGRNAPITGFRGSKDKYPSQAELDNRQSRRRNARRAMEAKAREKK